MDFVPSVPVPSGVRLELTVPGVFPPLEDGLPPFEDELPPFEDGLPPLEDELPPLEDGLPPPEDELPPLEDELPPFEDELSPLEEEVPVSSWEFAEEFSEEPPVLDDPSGAPGCTLSELP